MLRKYIKKLFTKFGYEVRRINLGVDRQEGFEFYKYLKEDGTFNYAEYKKAQIEGNKQKIRNVWAIEENISFLADYIKKTIGTVKFGICHGTRRGKEQEWFSKYLDCEAIGTEISDTAENFPNTIQWDFHEAKAEWINAVDFIYSNSFDHSYDPKKCLDVWMGCLRKGGICILEHSSGHEHAAKLDPFGANIVQLPYLISIWGNGRYGVRELIQAPARPQGIPYVYFIVIQRF